MTKYYSRSKQKFVDIEQMPDQYVRNAFVKMCGEETKIYVNWKKLAEDNFISGVDDLDKIESLTKENEKLKNRQYNSHDKDGRINLYYKEYAKLAKERDEWKEKSMNMIEKSTHTELEMENVRLVAQLEHDEHNVGKLDDTVSKDTYQVMWDNCQVLQNERAKLLKESNELKESLRQANLTPTVSTKAYDIAWKNIDELNDQVKRLLDRNAVLSRMYNNSLSTLGDVKMFSEIPNNPDGDTFIYLLRKYLNNVSYKIRVRGQYLDEETKKTEGWRKYERGQPIEKSKCLRVYVDTKKDVD